MSRTAEAADKTSVNAQKKRRLHQYKISFYAMTFCLQCIDLFSDIQAEVSYFMYGTGRNGMDSSGSKQLGDVFDVCYALHAVSSLLVSFLVLRRVSALFQNLYLRLQQKRLAKSAGSKAKRQSTTISATHALQRAAMEMASSEADRANSGDGVSPVGNVLSPELARATTDLVSSAG